MSVSAQACLGKPLQHSTYKHCNINTFVFVSCFFSVFLTTHDVFVFHLNRGFWWITPFVIFSGDLTNFISTHVATCLKLSNVAMELHRMFCELYKNILCKDFTQINFTEIKFLTAKTSRYRSSGHWLFWVGHWNLSKTPTAPFSKIDANSKQTISSVLYESLSHFASRTPVSTSFLCLGFNYRRKSLVAAGSWMYVPPETNKTQQNTTKLKIKKFLENLALDQNKQDCYMTAIWMFLFFCFKADRNVADDSSYNL